MASSGTSQRAVSAVSVPVSEGASRQSLLESIHVSRWQPLAGKPRAAEFPHRPGLNQSHLETAVRRQVSGVFVPLEQKRGVATSMRSSLGEATLPHTKWVTTTARVYWPTRPANAAWAKSNVVLHPKHGLLVGRGRYHLDFRWPHGNYERVFPPASLAQPTPCVLWLCWMPRSPGLCEASPMYVHHTCGGE
jgi:hypothetical protein